MEHLVTRDREESRMPERPVEIRPDGLGVVTLAFRLLDKGIAVEGEGPPLDPDRESKPSELSRTIVDAVVDDHDLSRDGDTLRFRLFKRAHHR
jgi:hypothetical protein